MTYSFKSFAGSEKERVASISMRRMGQPYEMVAAIDFLLSADARFIAGQALCVNGGGSL